MPGTPAQQSSHTSLANRAGKLRLELGAGAGAAPEPDLKGDRDDQPSR